MNTTNERIFAKDTDMMFWQQDNCTQCAKAVWYNARLGRCPKHNCALQRDMEAQAGGEMEINERSFRKKRRNNRKNRNPNQSHNPRPKPIRRHRRKSRRRKNVC